MDKSKKFTAWRIVGIVVLCLVVLGGFAGAYAMGTHRGALLNGDADVVWMHPMDRYGNENGDFDGSYDFRHPMGMNGYYGRVGHGMGFLFIGRILGGLLFLAFLGALLRLVFFPMHMRRHMMMRMGGHGYHGHRHHFHHGHDGCCCENGECECECKCKTQDEQCDCEHEEPEA